MTAPVFAVINPSAGLGRARALWPAVAERLRALGVDYEFELTQGSQTATSFVRQAFRRGAQTIIAIGGDGTVNEALNGFFLDGVLLNPDASLLIVPAGSSSDAARGLGIPPGLAAVDLIRAGRLQPVDVGKAIYAAHGRPMDRYFLNQAEIGIGGRITAGADRLKRLGGRLAFFLSSLRALSAPRPWEGSLCLDAGEIHAVRAVSAVVALGPFTGGGMEIAPGAKWDDGLFDVVVIEDMPPVELLLQFPRVYAGTHLSHSKVQHHHAQEVVVQTRDDPVLELDGEVAGSGEVEFRILPSAVQVHVPRP